MRPAVWFFKGLGLDERLSDDLLAQMKELGRMERWGHSGKVHGAGEEPAPTSARQPQPRNCGLVVKH